MITSKHKTIYVTTNGTECNSEVVALEQEFIEQASKSLAYAGLRDAYAASRAIFNKRSALLELLTNLESDLEKAQKSK